MDPKHYPVLLGALDAVVPQAIRDAGPESAANAHALFEARAAVYDALQQATTEAREAAARETVQAAVDAAVAAALAEHGITPAEDAPDA